MLVQSEGEEDDSISVTVSLSFSFSSTTSSHHGYGRETENSGENIWKAGVNNEPATTVTEEQPVKPRPGVGRGKETTYLGCESCCGTALPAENGKYKMPVMAGVTVEKMLNKYLGVESGLTYSSLRSENQNLHYLGVPVKVNVHLAETKKLDLYASIGGIVEKCIAGAPNNDFKNEPVQLAVIAGVGVNYKVNDRIALFAEREYRIISRRIQNLKRYVQSVPRILTLCAEFA